MLCCEEYILLSADFFFPHQYLSFDEDNKDRLELKVILTENMIIILNVKSPFALKRKPITGRTLGLLVEKTTSQYEKQNQLFNSSENNNADIYRDIFKQMKLICQQQTSFRAIMVAFHATFRQLK